MLSMYYQQSPSGWCRYLALGLKGSEGLLTIILPKVIVGFDAQLVQDGASIAEARHPFRRHLRHFPSSGAAKFAFSGGSESALAFSGGSKSKKITW